MLPCYLAEVGIGPLERVRRNMNCNLEGICQDLNMLHRLSSPEARQKIARHEAQLAAIKRTGERHGFGFTPPGRFRSAYLGDKPEPTMTLIDKCTARTRGVGASSYQILCGAAHPRLHGLSRFLMTDSQAAAGPGKVQTQLNVCAGELAQQLFVGPVHHDPGRASALVPRLGHRRDRPVGHLHDEHLVPDQRHTVHEPATALN